MERAGPTIGETGSNCRGGPADKVAKPSGDIGDGRSTVHAVRRSGHKPDRSFHDEPRPEGDDWKEHGGELMWVAGHTEGGVPFGFTVDEFRRANARDAAGAGWARAKHVLADLLELSCGPSTRADVGFVKNIGQGLSRDIFAAEVVLRSERGGSSGHFAVLLPRPDADAELDARTRKELRLLERLGKQTLPFRVPEVVGAYPESGHLALVRQFLSGIELDLRAGRQPGVRPWETVGEIAAAIHAMPATQFDDFLPGHVTRREHTENALRVLENLDAPEARDAHAWALAQLPRGEPTALVHGDLLGQNILLALNDPPAVIDWEYAVRGDPAYDLAIVTRGVKQPFQVERGLDKLLDAYYRHGGDQAVARDHVRVHELCLIAGWYRAALAGAGLHPADHELGRLRSLLIRCQRRA